MGLGAALSGLYIYTRHWLMNNLFAISFSISAIEMLSCNSFTIGAMLLSGLFFYDIFFVFGTDVMVTVAKSVQGPIKVVFPKDFLANGINSTMHGMLGLGDIAFRKPTGSLYFSVAMLAYFLGLVTTMGVMHFFQAAQPALLYLSPAGVLAPLLTAFLRGETSLLFKYVSNDHGAVNLCVP
ncbi:uncharacterized protein MONBRDRAFT_21539 [Monosiga brevicollis MX1]|uniref:Uncharacterized protein n=1 Tax=Monosiga brevicollis TaxID=81824 RepID=A9V0R9_MONBE|nr:uncharacterized protein MONBRDRAFT_21539 [Monosiga brevicollis MX1]EDQ88802.1 predicted protein [Monosiga brevicollis MX1]|eukprot:XP_001746415.1 hypothetical protein [Monosiga brevicollis MX1]